MRMARSTREGGRGRWTESFGLRRLVLVALVVSQLFGLGVAPGRAASEDPRRQGYGPRRTFEPPYHDAYADHLCYHSGGGFLGLFARPTPTCTVEQTVDKDTGRMTASMEVASPDGEESSGDSTAVFGVIHNWTSRKSVTGLDLEVTLDIGQLVMRHTGSTHASHSAYAIARPSVWHECSCASERGGWQELLRMPAGETAAELAPGLVVLRYPVYATAGYPIPPGDFRIRVSVIVYNDLGRYVYRADGSSYEQRDTGAVTTELDASLVSFKVTEQRVEDA